MTERMIVICELLRSFVDGSNRSISVAGELEVALDEEFPEDDECQELVLMLASYRPEGGEYLYDASAVARRCDLLLKRLCSVDQ